MKGERKPNENTCDVRLYFNVNDCLGFYVFFIEVRQLAAGMALIRVAADGRLAIAMGDIISEGLFLSWQKIPICGPATSL